MVKYLLMSVAAASVIAIGWPLVTAAFGGGPNEATQLVEATSRTNNKAESLNDSFTDVIPPAPPQSNLDPSQPAQSAQEYANSTFGGPSGNSPPQGTTEQSAAPEVAPTPDPYAAYEHPSEHAVRDAMEYLGRLQTELEPSRAQYIQAVEQLQQAWTPRYERAVQEYKRFAYRIDHADAMASEYFRVQQNLTSRLSSPEERQRAELIDATEHMVYLNWRDQAFRTLGQAQFIMAELHDMNVIITKQSLSAHFASLYEEFHTIPPAITLLHQELARFRQESERIQETFGVQVP